MPFFANLEKWRPCVLSILRLVAALLFLQHGLGKFFGFPTAGPPLTGLIILAAVIETFGSLLLLVGLFSRWAALIMSGEMAFAYFMAHAPKSFYPAVNGGNLAVLLFRVPLSVLRGARSVEHRPRDEAGVAARRYTSPPPLEATSDDKGGGPCFGPAALIGLFEDKTCLAEILDRPWDMSRLEPGLLACA
jgi:putative oxidoreductase